MKERVLELNYSVFGLEFHAYARNNIKLIMIKMPKVSDIIDD